MDPFSSILFDIFKNVLSNRIDSLLFQKPESKDQPQLSEEVIETESAAVIPVTTRRRFKTFDAVYDLETLLNYVDQPVVYLLIEDSPSSAYNLLSYVLESGTTGEWFVFGRGRLALQGSGGGHQNTERVFNRLGAKDVKIGAWVIERSLLDQLDMGQILWPEVKLTSVPLLAVLSEDYSWAAIQQQFNKLSESKRS